MATSLAKAGLKTALVEALYEDILSNKNNYYYFVGNILQWNGRDTPIDVEDTAAYEQDVRRDIIFFKKITSADVIFSIPRYNWSMNQVFDQYDDQLGQKITATASGINNTTVLSGTFADLVGVLPIGYTASGTNIAIGSKVVQVTPTSIILDRRHTGNVTGTVTFTNVAPSGATSLQTSKLYCMTSDYHVYKCLNNNNGAPSTVRPYSTSYQPITLSDGYTWKYMYTVPKAFINKFTSNTDIPVATSLKSAYYTSGALTNFVVESYGSGYDESQVTLNVLGDGFLAENPLKVTSVIIDNGGSGYQEGAEVGARFQDPFENQPFTANTPYLLGTYVKTEEGKIYEVTYPGTSSGTAPTHTGDTPIPNGTLQFKFVGLTPKLSVFTGYDASVGDPDKIVDIELTGIIGYVDVTSPGFGYTSETEVTISATGTGSGAIATASPLNGRINRINMIDRGINYDAATVTFAPPIDVTNIKRRYFNPSDTLSFNASANLFIVNNHGYDTEEAVTYGANGNIDITGLTDGSRYYVIKITDDLFKLAANKEDAQTDEKTLTFNPTNTAVLKLANNLIVNVGHGLQTGTPVKYSTNGGTAIGGLVNDTLYFAIRVDSDSFQLASTYENSVSLLTKTFNGSSNSVIATTNTGSTANTITIPSHGFVSGDNVLYSAGNGTSVGGITTNSNYFVIREDGNTIRLATTYNNAVASSLELSFVGQASVSASLDQITYSNHGLQTGDSIVYYHDGTAIGGLTTDTTYYAVRVDDNNFKLATSFINATQPTPNVRDLSITETQFTFLQTAVDQSQETITSTNHGLVTGNKVLYTHNGTAIDGLVSGTEYYAIRVSSSVIKLALSSADATSGTAINLTRTGQVSFVGSVSNINTSTETITFNNHGFTTDTPVVYTHSGTAIGGLVSGTTYYILRVDDNSFRLKTSGGSTINLSSTGGASTTQTFTSIATTHTITNITTTHRFNRAINLTAVGTGTNHSFTLQGTPIDLTSGAVGTTHSLVVEGTAIDLNTTNGNGQIQYVERNFEWEPEHPVVVGDYVVVTTLGGEQRFYKVVNSINVDGSGILGLDLPNHISGRELNGTVELELIGITATGQAEIYYGYGYSSNPQIIVDPPVIRDHLWNEGATVAATEIVQYNDNFYRVTSATGGELGSIPPTHTVGMVENGDVELTFIGQTAVLNALTEKTQAKVTPIVENGQLVGVISTNPGTAYTTASIQVVSNSGFGAVVKPVLSIGDIESRQANVELLAVPGTIDSIQIVHPGLRYYGSPAVTISGDGTGATARVITRPGTSTIDRIEVVNKGSNYTYATVTIEAPSSDYQDRVQAYARAVVSPFNGHGANAVTELNANGLIIASSFADERNQGIVVDNDFRRVGLIKNPAQYNRIYRFNEMTGSACYLVTGTFNYNYFRNTPDALITDKNGKEFRLVSLPDPETQISGYNPTTENVVGEYSILIQSVDNTTVKANDTLFYGTNFSTRVTAVRQPTVDKYSGQMMFIDNRAAFAPSLEQTISFKTTIKL